MIVDFGYGGVVSIEIEQASEVVERTSEIQFAIAE